MYTKNNIIFKNTQFQTASSIIDLLKNYNQTDTQLKTQNIFSLAPTSPAQINNMRETYLTLDIDPVVSFCFQLGLYKRECPVTHKNNVIPDKPST